MNKAFWEKKLLAADREFGFPDGYKLLYSPWETISHAKTAFISLNPGRPPVNEPLQMVSDERGNSYEVEQETTASPITDQFLKLCTLLKTPPGNILTGTICPIRSGDWDTFLNGKPFTAAQKRIGFDLGCTFWAEALQDIDLVITIGNETIQKTIKMLDARKDLEIQSGWGTLKLRRYVTEHNVKVIQLPHLSRFKLFSRKQCTQPLLRILER